jgi:glutamate-1-semialdehyde 2,1-aminomutase
VTPRNETTPHAAADRELESYLHLYLLNRGVLITPFHNMVLISPATTAADIEQHEQYFAAAVAELFAR